MTKKQVYNLAINCLIDNKLNRDFLSEGWSFAFNSRKKTIGLCNYNKKTIFYSIHFLNNSDEDILDTILHEIAHACTSPKDKHNHIWRRWCIILGAKPIRCGNSNDLTKEHLKSIAKYVAECPNCHNEFVGHRKKKRNSSCAKCSNGVYNESFKLVYKKVK